MDDMIMPADQYKAWIDAADYESLLRRWRRSPVGDSIFIGEIGQYYKKEMLRKREELDHDAQVEISKRIG